MVNILRQSRSTAAGRCNSTRTHNQIYVSILSILFILLVWTSVRIEYYDAVEEKSNTTQVQPAHAHMKHLFIDVGANCGNSYWKIKNDPNNQVLDSENWETYLWECNPQMNKFFLRELADSDPSIHLIEKAASTENGALTFYLTAGQEEISEKSQFPGKGVCDPNNPHSPSGASTLYGSAKRAGNNVTVESVNFVEWFDDLIEAQHLKDGNETKVVLKMDIEGAEKDILEMMSRQDASDAICKINMMWMEYHSFIFEEGTDEYDAHVKFENEFPTMFETKCGRKLEIGGWH